MNANTDRNTTPTNQSRNQKNLFPLASAQASTTPPDIEEALARIGIKNPLAIPTPQAAAYLSLIKNVPIAKSTLEIFRCRSTGPKYKKIGGRVFYERAWLDEYAEGVPVHVFDPSKF